MSPSRRMPAPRGGELQQDRCSPLVEICREGIEHGRDQHRAAVGRASVAFRRSRSAFGWRPICILIAVGRKPDAKLMISAHQRLVAPLNWHWRAVRADRLFETPRRRGSDAARLRQQVKCWNSAMMFAGKPFRETSEHVRAGRSAGMVAVRCRVSVPFRGRRYRGRLPGTPRRFYQPRHRSPNRRKIAEQQYFRFRL